MKTIKKYKIVYNGNAFYEDQNNIKKLCKNLCTDYDAYALGCGCTEKEAFENALKQITMQQYNIQSNKNLISEFRIADPWANACLWLVPELTNKKYKNMKIRWYIGLGVK